jgi:hypothetical protein
MVGVFVFFASLQSSFSFVPYVKLVYIYIYTIRFGLRLFYKVIRGSYKDTI